MSREGNRQPQMIIPGKQDLATIITSPEGAQELVKWAQKLGEALAPRNRNDREALTTSQIRALFGEVRRIQAEWSIEGRRDQALRHLILLKPKMAYRARKERGKGVRNLVKVLDPALDLVIEAQGEEQDRRFQRFVEFFEAILAYHKAYGGN